MKKQTNKLSPCRHIWWSSGQTPGEVPGPHGKPEGPESRLRLQTTLWSLPAEVAPPVSSSFTVWIKVFNFVCVVSRVSKKKKCSSNLRYKPLCPDTWPNWRGSLADGVSTLVNHLGYKPEEYKLGRWVAVGGERGEGLVTCVSSSLLPVGPRSSFASLKLSSTLRMP